MSSFSRGNARNEVTETVRVKSKVFVSFLIKTTLSNLFELMSLTK